MIHLVAVKIGERKWAVTTSDMVKKYKISAKLIKKMRESGREWIEDALKKESGSENQPHWSVVYDKEPVK